jgi:deoxycytidylate deaminase
VLANARGHILAVGYNGVAAGMPHCNREEQSPIYHDDPRVHFRISDNSWEFDGQAFACMKGTGYSSVRQCVGFEARHPHACKGQEGSQGKENCEAVHAEQNALLQCHDAWQIQTAYVTRSPCIACLKLLLNTSCQRIVVAVDRADSLPKELWLKAGRDWEFIEGEKS